MRRVDLRLALDAQVLQDRNQRLAEAAERVLRLPDVDDAEAVFALSGNVRQQTLDGPVGRRLEPALPVGDPADGLLVVLLGETR